MGYKILIIGNGFDLDCKLNTRYSDFIESQIFQKLAKRNQLAIFLQKKASSAQWVDIEKNISEATEFGTLIKMYGSLDQRIQRDQFYNEYIELKKALHEFLQEQENNTPIDFDSAAAKLIKNGGLLYEGNEVKKFNRIFSFNYTATVNKITNHYLQSNAWDATIFTDRPKISAYGRIIPDPQAPQILPDYKTEYLHGSLLKGNIVFGAEDGSKVSDDFSFIFKTYTQAYFESADLSYEINRADEVHFFGCALGETDSTRFKPIFKLLSKNEMVQPPKKKIYFYVRPIDYPNIYNRLRSLTDNSIGHLAHNSSIFFVDTTTNKILQDPTYI